MEVNIYREGNLGQTKSSSLLENSTYGNRMYTGHNDFSVGVQMCRYICRYIYTSGYEL